MGLAMQVLGLVSVHFLSLISPGPDFLLVTKNSMLDGRRVGMWTAIGVISANVAHVLYASFIVFFFASNNLNVLFYLRLLGAIYLFYIGVVCLSTNVTTSRHALSGSLDKATLKDFDAIKMGFFTSLLNPKASLYFLSVITQYISLNQSPALNILFVMVMITLSCFWFLTLSVFAGTKSFRNFFILHDVFINRLMGVFFVLFAFMMLFKF